MSNYVIF